MSDKKKKAAEISYAEASREIEAILQEIESGEIDLDVLTDRVERAAQLLAICRERLAATETKVRKVVEDLNAAASTAAEDDTESSDEEPQK